MSALRKMTNFLGYSEPTDDDFADAPEAVPTDFTQDLVGEYADREDEGKVYDAPFEEVPAPAEAPDLRRIVTVHPSTYNEARVIGEAFRDGVPVIINLTNMSESDARRMVDFAAGLVFGLHGAIERVTPRVFLLTPTSVEIDDGEGSEDAHGRFFNQS
ncbi:MULTISPECIES: cell division protein SepF [unclassified Actinomyces]|uniref:cell division protein SepF n=1 Tax=unclassified Actinomyces TaxID=2609248 RepID=UPI0013743CE5|nr:MULTISPECIES: cell division protein SepF [unclassified Actinomyces]MBW3069738.1 cell division protein SepF [Actinomyces sp. 594]NDR52767.1 cell division protein SepF [Actinomyces sp. 565]QHO91229.1 cell division protein SepF [Actinomyces sp. 432]